MSKSQRLIEVTEVQKKNPLSLKIYLYMKHSTNSQYLQLNLPIITVVVDFNKFPILPSNISILHQYKEGKRIMKTMML